LVEEAELKTEREMKKVILIFSGRAAKAFKHGMVVQRRLNVVGIRKG
jgi:hypothetical protein